MRISAPFRGINLGTLGADNASGLAPKKRMDLGLTLTYPLSERWSVDFAGRYGQREGLLKFGRLEMGTVQTNYIEWSALGKLHLPLAGRNVSAHLLLGPALGKHTSCQLITRYEGTAESPTRTNENCRDARLDTSTFDFALVGGAGIEFGLTERIAGVLGVQYTHGLMDFNRSEWGSMKNRTWELVFGIKIR